MSVVNTSRSSQDSKPAERHRVSRPRSSGIDRDLLCVHSPCAKTGSREHEADASNHNVDMVESDACDNAAQDTAVLSLARDPPTGGNGLSAILAAPARGSTTPVRRCAAWASAHVRWAGVIEPRAVRRPNSRDRGVLQVRRRTGPPPRVRDRDHLRASAASARLGRLGEAEDARDHRAPVLYPRFHCPDTADLTSEGAWTAIGRPARPTQVMAAPMTCMRHRLQIYPARRRARWRLPQAGIAR